ncbi:synaptotagmin-like protein 2 isoform X3 [Cololabis saira]|uniref:synaptotagmin-like protein 2 isoform X3 n=1 Tax=Cololabis saira TaxID=129043 RepID=UPI002AD4FCA3|nr:synaptotagmin-like protein 2 isoform X3 [Cololabis saira]
MIDLSHLTEEEQGVIMAVLRRDADLKKAEEERVRKLEQIPPSDSPADVDMKYLTGEWFYEAKSLRHSDKIHGSEIILASMKQGRPAGSDGSLRFNRSKAFSSRSLEIKAPQKPARSFETPQPQPEPEPEAFCSLVVPKNDAEKENRYSAIHSPRMIRHNPFNRASLIVVEPTENNYDMSVGQDQEPQETEPISPLKNHPAGESSHISRGPITSEGSSAGFRPVPKKRTFLSRRTSSQSESNGQLGSDGPERPAGIVPAPRRRLQRTSTGSSNQSCLKDKDEAPQKSASEKIVQSAQPSRTADDISSQLLCDYPQISSISSLERERKTCSVETDRSASYTRTDMSTEREMPKRSEDGDDQNQRERGASNFISLQRTNIKDEENSSSVAAVVRQEAPSLPQSIVGENDDEEKNPVRKALRRAEARPKNLAKSMEDITASVSPRQERRQDPIADSRRGSDVLAMTSPTASLLSDADHLKNMSKSVPSFLQKEASDRDTDSTCELTYPPGRPRTGSSVTNLSGSTGMASMSSLSGSVMTMYSGDFVEVQGNIQFSINYVQRLREFHIFVAECHGLAAVDPKRGRSDPYVKSYLVPDKANLGKRKTSVKKKTLNPTFNEILRYRVRMEYLRTQTLILSVWHHDTFGRNSFLGEVDLDLSKWDFDHTQMNYLALKARTTPTVAPPDVRGEMKLAIRFLPQITHSEGITKDAPNTGEIHIWVKECKNLPLIRATIDPYVKCFVLPDTSRKSRQKTRVLRRTTDPVFNHTMVYDGISEVDLTDACIELTVWDRDRLASNLLGGLRLGAGTGRSYGALVDWMDSGPYEVALWKRMMASQNEWVEDVLPLRMLNSAKTAFK